MENNNITYRQLNLSDLNSTLLNNFNRFQETNHVWFKDKDEFQMKEDHFIEQWDQNKKECVIESLQKCISTGGIVIGAFINNDLKAFASVEGEIFGSNKEYVELSYIHVSKEDRGIGIGKKIFELCCEKAKTLNAKKLYIGAHPSKESQKFYRAVGCGLAVEIDKKIYEREPLDIQMEILL